MRGQRLLVLVLVLVLVLLLLLVLLVLVVRVLRRRRRRPARRARLDPTRPHRLGAGVGERGIRVRVGPCGLGLALLE